MIMLGRRVPVVLRPLRKRNLCAILAGMASVALRGVRAATVLTLPGLAAVLAATPPLTAMLVTPGRPESGYFEMGTPRTPDGHLLTLDSMSLRRDGQPWVPAMGEFHYTRYPAAEWREELLKMKAGGIDIVSTYVFWIHHEEREGGWNWSGDRDLRRFVQTAREVGLDVVVRCGPWCHGEVRNGGLPDWVVAHRDWKLRSTDQAFLAAVRRLYAQIAGQLDGLLWKNGGPVIGIQLDNEYHGPAEYLLALKSLARDVGLDVPLYTRTGWPALTTPMPTGAIVPLYGAYAEGFWDRELTSMPGRYWAVFQFSALRSDAAIATEMLGHRAAPDAPDVAKYPYLTCEIGGGMMNSYHRRVLVDPRDVMTTTLIKVAGGSTLPGYYMYHGGTNPDGRTPMMEAQDTEMTNYNDLPLKTYDFQAPLGEFGEVRPQYHLLRRLHLLLHDHGAELAAMTAVMPDQRPSGRDDETTLRWAARSDGRRGFVFISNYERGKVLPPKPAVQFSLKLANGQTLVFPTQPVTIESGVAAIWPFHLDLHGIELVSAAAQPITHVAEANGIRTLFFAETPGVKAEFVFDEDQVERVETSGRISHEAGQLRVTDVGSGHGAALRLLGKNGNVVQIVLLSEADSLALWTGAFAGRQRVVLTRANLVFDGGALRVTATEPGRQALAVYPAPARLAADATVLSGAPDGVFKRYALDPGFTTETISFETVTGPGPLRRIPISRNRQGVAMEPTDADFRAAAEWRVKVPGGLDRSRRPMLRFHYVGDVARVLVGKRIVTDDFYNGRSRDVGLWRVADASQPVDLRFAVLPLQQSAPIFLPAAARPDFGTRAAIADLDRVELIQAVTFTLTGAPGDEPVLPANFRTDAATPRRGL